MGTPARLLALVSLAAIVTLVFLVGQDPSPGPLAAVHARAEALAGLDGCAACHGESGQSLADACLQCHAVIHDQMKRGEGLHGALEEGVARACGDCHGEHHGEDFDPISEASFALAGIEDLEGYDHRHVVDPLHGAHLGLACGRCHPYAATQPLPLGAQRYLGLSSGCSSCHEDPHEGRLPNCEACHGQARPFVELADFEHDEGFSLVGGHADLACSACHEPGGPSAVEEVGAPDFQRRARLCSECHLSPHAEEFTSAIASLASRRDGGETCAECHDPAHASWTPSELEVTRRWHGASGFELGESHAGLDCAACHEGGEAARTEYAQRFPGRDARDCAACHGDPHEGQFDRGAFAGSSCVECHEDAAFVPSRFDDSHHARTSFPLAGAHRGARCVDCHPPDANGVLSARVFAAAPSECASCHADPHRGQFTNAEGTLGCESCHVVEAFHPSSFDFERHALAALPLKGRHRELACTACHVPHEGAERPGDLVFVGTAQRCELCHADPHRDQFQDPTTRRTDCARCHDSQAFTRSAFTQAEHADTAFPLSGAHLAVGCQRCHPSEGAQGLRRFRGISTACVDCHADVHDGRFDRDGLPREVAGARGCARCHSAESFRAVDRGSFDHGTWTGYALVGRHARARCEDCHPVDPSPRAPRRLREAPQRCDGCHADPHAGQFREPGGTDCARCHAPEASSFELRAGFDHARDAGFLLDEAHAPLACSACHQPFPTRGGAEVVRYRPLGKRCQDCHVEGTKKRRGR